ncbi:MAG: LamG-like jellyroll fold domain-containing protein [Verrucomicrobiales bacterium]
MIADSADLEFPQGQDFTLSLFFKSGEDSDTNNGLLSKGYSGGARSSGGYYQLQINAADQIQLDSRAGSGSTPCVTTASGYPAFTDGQWHHVACVRDGAAGEIRLYVDCTLIDTVALNAADGGDWGMGVNAEPLVIGNHFNRYTNGWFDDVAIWNEALSLATLQEICAEGVAAVANSDNDELPDEWERDHFRDLDEDEFGDVLLDNDGLTNGEEYIHGTDPNKPDTDDDENQRRRGGPQLRDRPDRR